MLQLPVNVLLCKVHGHFTELQGNRYEGYRRPMILGAKVMGKLLGWGKYLVSPIALLDPQESAALWPVVYVYIHSVCCRVLDNG